jgi:protein SCO1/2
MHFKSEAWLRRTLCAIVMTATVFAAAGCGSSNQQPAAAQSQNGSQTASTAPLAEVKRYHLEGKVVSIDREHKRLVIDHKDIPGFMAAMTMPYPVVDEATLDRAHPGDQITADVVMTGNEIHLENVVVVKAGGVK